jgi:glycosyltransferase involved in cell wall biosynthesis
MSESTTAPRPHVSVCICTHKRADLLARLLRELEHQDTDGLFTYSIVVADNDQAESGRPVVDAFKASSSIEVRYCVEPRQNIALTRNKAVENARGDFVAFIDDDEFPIRRWLLHLFTCLHEHGVDGVMGPVRPYFEQDAPRWVIDGGFYDRPVYPTGMRLNGDRCRTGNVLVKAQLFANQAEPFRAECVTGEDIDFFGRMIQAGHVFIACKEAEAYEVVPPGRWKRDFIIRRALLRGVFSLRNRGSSPQLIAQSLIAAPAYAVALPIALLLGQVRFMSCAFKLSYHLGTLLASLGINPVGTTYVTE